MALVAYKEREQRDNERSIAFKKKQGKELRALSIKLISYDPGELDKSSFELDGCVVSVAASYSTEYIHIWNRDSGQTWQVYTLADLWPFLNRKKD